MTTPFDLDAIRKGVALKAELQSLAHLDDLPLFELSRGFAKTILRLITEVEPLLTGELVVVPKEPTEAMAIAGSEQPASSIGEHARRGHSRRIYRAMLTAALTKPEEERTK